MRPTVGAILARRAWAKRSLSGFHMVPDHGDTGVKHGPEPHPELHARCCRCGRRWPEHDEVTGACPDTD